MKLTLFSLGFLLLIVLSACGSFQPSPTPSPTLVPGTDTPTVTINWFPATNTPSPFPTQTILSTPEQRPGVGELLFTDSFDQPALWSTAEASSAGAVITRNQLILSISGSGPLHIASMRKQPILGDFYAEATVTLSLCGGTDQFGITFRTAPGQNFYRLTLACSAQVRLERTLSGSTVPLLNWMSSGDAPIAAPAQVKLGVWAAGSEMRFFLNDHFQFSVRDPVLHSGTFGFFVFASGAAPITASFSNLSVYSVFYVSPTPSPATSSTPTYTLTPISSPTPTP